MLTMSPSCSGRLAESHCQSRVVAIGMLTCLGSRERQCYSPERFELGLSQGAKRTYTGADGFRVAIVAQRRGVCPMKDDKLMDHVIDMSCCYTFLVDE